MINDYVALQPATPRIEMRSWSPGLSRSSPLGGGAAAIIPGPCAAPEFTQSSLLWGPPRPHGLRSWSPGLSRSSPPEESSKHPRTGEKSTHAWRTRPWTATLQQSLDGRKVPDASLRPSPSVTDGCLQSLPWSHGWRVPKLEYHVTDTGCCYRDGFQDSILAVFRDGQGAARGVPKRLVLGTA